MAKLGINTGSTPNDGTGDTLLAAALKINQNFDEIYNIFGDGTNISGSIAYAQTSGFSTYSSTSDISNYSSVSGVSSYSSVSGISTYALLAGLSTYSQSSGISSVANYSPVSGISTLSQGITGTPDINVSLVSASSLDVEGNSNIVGILTVGESGVIIDGPNNIITVGSGVTINGNTGIISATSFYANGLNVGIITADTIIYEGATLETYWKSNSSGISTSANVGIGNTLPTSKLTVTGNALFTGIVTASSFSGNGSALSGVLKNVIEDTTPQLGGLLDVNGNTIYGTGAINITGVTTSDGGYRSGTNITFDYDVLYATWGPLTTENFRIRTFNNVGTNIPGVEFATSREASEIYVRQYSFTQNVFGAIENQVTLLNNVGNTIFFNNVGIGTTLPSSKLSVTGDGRFTGVVTASSFRGGSEIGVSSAGVYLGFATQFNFVGTGITLSTQYNSASGIATFVFSGASSGTGTGDSYWSPSIIGIHTLSNVGIGTTNPTSTLTVNGTLSVSGISTFGSAKDLTIRYFDSINSNFIYSDEYDLLIGTKAETGQNTNYIALVGIHTGNDAYSSNSSYVTLRQGNSDIKLQTLGAGVTVTGTTFTNQLSVSGVSTFRGTNNTQVHLGNAGYAGISWSGIGGVYSGNEPSILTNSGLGLDISGGIGDLTLSAPTSGGDVIIKAGNFAPTAINCVGNGAVELYNNGNKKFETTSTGAVVTGILTATQINGTIIGSIDNAVNLTGGTANASSLNVSGIATISAGRIQANASSNLRFGNLPAGSGSGRNIAIGDQVLVSLSGGQGRNIGIGELSYYDTTTGQYNIGIGERAGQKVSTGSYNVILGAYDGNSGNLDIRTSSNNVVIADGQGNIRQYINSSGNVGIKTTVVTEALTVAGVVSATSFYGTLNAEQLTGVLPVIDGSNLFGVTSTGSGVEIRDDGSVVGTAATINFGPNISVSFSSGIATITGGDTSKWTSTSAGIYRLSNVGIGSTNPKTPLQIGNVHGIDTGSGSFSGSPGVSFVGNSWTVSNTNFKTAEYTLWFQHTSGVQSQKVLVMSTGTLAYSQEYAIMYSNSPLVSVGATIESGVAKLLWTPESEVSGTITYRFTRETIL
jgi:hypothetical protein